MSSGKLTPQDLAEAGISVEDLKGFVRNAEGRDRQGPPTFADFLREMDRAVKGGEGGGGPRSEKQGEGRLRGVTDALKESVDLEYRDLLEEYYRSLADPRWWRRPR